MVASLSLILLCQLIGEASVRGSGLPLPGPVLGLMVLLIMLLARDRFAFIARGPLRNGEVEKVGKGLLSHLSLLFVPAGVGVTQKLELVAAYGVDIGAILALSLVVTLLATMLTFWFVSRLIMQREP